MSVLGILIMLVAAVGVECGPANAEWTVRDATPGFEARSEPEATPAPEGRAREAVRAAGTTSRGADSSTVSAAVLDRRTGEFDTSENGSRAMYSASLSKLILVIDVLQRRSKGLDVTDHDLGLIRRALSLSDDDAMNELWTRFDGNSGVGRVARQLRLDDTRPPSDPAQWGETLMSARDSVRILDHVLSGMAEPDRGLILESLDGSPRIAAGGFDQGYGLHRPRPGVRAAVKAGWMCCLDSKIEMHSMGIVGDSRRFVVALLSMQPKSVGYDGAREVLNDEADAVLAPLR